MDADVADLYTWHFAAANRRGLSLDRRVHGTKKSGRAGAIDTGSSRRRRGALLTTICFAPWKTASALDKHDDRTAEQYDAYQNPRAAEKVEKSLPPRSAYRDITAHTPSPTSLDRSTVVLSADAEVQGRETQLFCGRRPAGDGGLQFMWADYYCRR